MELTSAFFKFQWDHLQQLFALVCLVAVVYKLSTLLAKRAETMRFIDAFPGPPRHWFFGNALEFKVGKEFENVLKWSKQYPYVFPVWFGPFICSFTINHPDYVKSILSSSEPKDDFAYKFIESWIGDGLLLSKGQKWFRHRRLLTPGFHYDVLKPYVNRMSESAKTMLDKWDSYAITNESFELFEHVSLMTLDSILKCAFSHNSNCQLESGKNEYIKAVYELSTIINRRVRMFPYHNNLIFYFSPLGYRYRKACKVAHDHTEEIIRKRQEALKQEEDKEGSIKHKRHMDFLDILLLARDEKQQGLSVEDMRAEVDTFMFEGHDTTASGLSFILYNLACHPEHQQMCRDEINEVLDGKETMEWEDLSKIPYTTMCIKESLRLYPPVPGISRKITKPMTFFDGRTLPAGTLVGTTVFGIHRNPTVWENPDEFDPLRFLPENVSKRSPHAFVPFSAGPRNCIGQAFAMNEMKVLTALMLKRYYLIEDPTRKPQIIPRLVLRSLNGIYIKIKPVE
uniref:cytochrome P450 4T8 n=1 Tax=Semicossyphus pulcher TaxID=241346 RepID=UPI0037E7945B